MTDTTEVIDKSKLKRLVTQVFGEGYQIVPPYDTHYADDATIARIAELERENAELLKDAERLDHIEAERTKSIRRGFQWNTFYYEACQSALTIRQQIDAAIASEKENERGR